MVLIGTILLYWFRMSNKISQLDFEKALRDVIATTDQVIVIYSGLWSFAGRLECSYEDAPAWILDVLLDVVGDQRTLVMPCFTNYFPKTKRLDLKRDKSDCSGDLPNYALAQDGFTRTKNAIHSYLVRGPMSDDVLSLTATSSWGKDSILGWFDTIDARICPLGLPWHLGCSPYHHMEEIQQVPYRYFKKFSGDLFYDGAPIGTVEENKFCADLNVQPIFAHVRVNPHLVQTGDVQKAANKIIPLQSVPARTIYNVTRTLLEDDPYFYVKNREEVEQWVSEGCPRKS